MRIRGQAALSTWYTVRQLVDIYTSYLHKVHVADFGVHGTGPELVLGSQLLPGQVGGEQRVVRLGVRDGDVGVWLVRGGAGLDLPARGDGDDLANLLRKVLKPVDDEARIDLGGVDVALVAVGGGREADLRLPAEALQLVLGDAERDPAGRLTDDAEVGEVVRELGALVGHGGGHADAHGQHREDGRRALLSFKGSEGVVKLLAALRLSSQAAFGAAWCGRDGG